MLSSLSLVLFDVGNVLIQLRPWESVLPLHALPPGVDSSMVLQSFSDSEFVNRFERGQEPAEAIYRRMRRLFTNELTDEEIRTAYLGQLGDPMPGMEEVVGEIKSRGTRVAGFSNTTPIHDEELLTYPAVALLEQLVTSCGIGLSKPDVVAYEKALRILNAEANSTLFIDDRADNVEGARKAGMHALRFEGVDALRVALGLTTG